MSDPISSLATNRNPHVVTRCAASAAIRHPITKPSLEMWQRMCLIFVSRYCNQLGLASLR